MSLLDRQERTDADILAELRVTDFETHRGTPRQVDEESQEWPDLIAIEARPQGPFAPRSRGCLTTVTPASPCPRLE